MSSQQRIIKLEFDINDQEYETVLSLKLPPNFRRFFRGDVYFADVSRLSEHYRNADEMSETVSSLDIYRTVDKKRLNKTVWPWLIFGTFLSFVFLVTWFFLLCCIVTLVVWLIETGMAKTTVVYDGTPEDVDSCRKFYEQFTTLKHAELLWLKLAHGLPNVGSQRKRVNYDFDLPEGVISNINFPCLDATDYKIFFAPDVLIIQTTGSIAVHSYGELITYNKTMSFKEVDERPTDAKTVRHEYKHSTVSGNPDLRFKHNPRYPVNEYPALGVGGEEISFDIIGSHPSSFIGLDMKSFFKPVVDNSPVSKNYALPTLNVIPTRSESLPKSEIMTTACPRVQNEHASATDLPQTSKLIAKNADELTRLEITSNIQNASLQIHSTDAYTIPQPSSQHIRWISREQVVNVQGINIEGGFFYFTPNRHAQPHSSLIEGDLPLGNGHGDFCRQLHGYYPNYRAIEPDDRRAFLNFLASDRSNPQTGIGFVFLYFYGLERRLMQYVRKGIKRNVEIEAAILEIRRLLDIFSTNNSFKRYAAKLIDFFHDDTQVVDPETVLSYVLPKPETGIISGRVPKRDISIALAQLVEKNSLVSLDWAYVWFHQFPVSLDGFVFRNKSLLYKTFSYVFNKRYPSGFKASPGAPLVTSYYASAGDMSVISLPIGTNLTDVVNFDGNLDNIKDLIIELSKLTESYSRSRKKHNFSNANIEPFLDLPVMLWPEKFLNVAENLVSGNSARELFLYTITDSFKIKNASKSTLIKLFTNLAALGIHSEPSQISSAKVSKPENTLILFRSEPNGHLTKLSPAFSIALIYIELAAVFIKATDSAQNLSEFEGLSDFEHKLLSAKASLLQANPTPLTKIKGRISQLPNADRYQVAKTLVSMTSASDKLTPAKIKLFEKIFNTLAIPDKLQLYVNEVSKVKESVLRKNKLASLALPEFNRSQDNDIVLDFAKIAALQTENLQVSSLLSTVFDQDHEIADSYVKADTHVATTPLIFSVGFSVFADLKPKQAAFLETVLTRNIWPRDELDKVASSFGLMLDGSIELINELSWDCFDDSLIGGEEDLELNTVIATQIINSKNKE